MVEYCIPISCRRPEFFSIYILQFYLAKSTKVINSFYLHFFSNICNSTVPVRYHLIKIQFLLNTISTFWFFERFHVDKYHDFFLIFYQLLKDFRLIFILAYATIWVDCCVCTYIPKICLLLFFWSWINSLIHFSK